VGQVVSTSCSADDLVMSLERPLDARCLGACSLSIVNQVLVRLWARCGRKSDRMWSVSREGFLVGDGSSRDRGNVFRGVCCVLSQDDPVHRHQSSVVSRRTVREAGFKACLTGFLRTEDRRLKTVF